MTTVLVTEDEWDIRELLVDTLLDSGFDAIEASNGSEALDRVSRDHPDIILLDLWMPEMDGFQTLERLREDPETRKIPVVLLTAMPAADGERQALELGVAHYINKPWEPGMVEATLRVALREAGRRISQGGGEFDVDEMNTEADRVDVNTPDTHILSMQGGLARLRAGKKRKTEDEDEGEVIGTGEKLVALERIMGGGVPMGSLTLVAGAAASGKSVLCQHMTYGALVEDQGVAYFSSEHTPESLTTQMKSIGLDVDEYVRKRRLQLYSVPEPVEGEEPAPLLTGLATSIEQLSRGSKLIVIDSLTDLAGSCPEQTVIAFFTSCRRIANKGRTIFVSIHTYAFGAEMFTRLRTLCDGFMTIGSEQVRGRSVRVLEVNKINTTDLTNNNTVSFVVEPETGMRVIPLSKTKV